MRNLICLFGSKILFCSILFAAVCLKDRSLPKFDAPYFGGIRECFH